MSATSASHQEFLGRIRIASPCSARWEEMSGDERVRFCQHCRKNVYNFTAMSAEETVALIRAKEGNLCGRFYQRADGTLIAENCPVGLELVRQHARRALMAVAAMVAFLFTSVAMAKHREADGAVLQKGKVSEKVEETVDKIKLKLGLTPPRPTVLAGAICVLPVKPVTTNTLVSTGKAAQ